MDLPPATCGKSNSCRGRGVLARDATTRPPPRNALGYQDLHAALDCGRRVHRLVVGRRKVAGGSDSNFHFIICTLCGLCCRNGISRQLALTIWDEGARPNKFQSLRADGRSQFLALFGRHSRTQECLLLGEERRS